MEPEPNHKPRQHVVQKRLLYNFTSTPLESYEKSRIWMRDKQRGTDIEVSLTNAAVLKNFLSDKADSNITLIENECFPIIERIIDRKCVTCHRFSDHDILKNLTFLYRYLAAQLHRTISFRNYLEEIMKPFYLDEGILKTVQSLHFNELLTHNMFTDYGFGRSLPEKKGELANLYFSLVRRLSMIPLMQVDGAAGSIMDISAPVFCSNNTQIPFIQNDIGLVPFFPLNGASYNMKLFVDGATLVSILCFPLNPWMCIHLCTNKSILEWSRMAPADSDRGLLIKIDVESNIKQTNSNLLRFSENFGFSNTKIEPFFLE